MLDCVLDCVLYICVDLCDLFAYLGWGNGDSE